MAFGDIRISKDIIDSEIMISGRCINPGGSIIASKIWAKLGVEAGLVGTTASSPPRLIVGTHSHIDTLILKIDEALEDSVAKSKLLKDEIKALENEDRGLYEQISEKAQIQDKAELELKEMVAELKSLEKSGDLTQIPMISEEIKTIRQTVRTAEQELNGIFETQDRIARKIQAIKDQLDSFEEKNSRLVREKKTLKEFRKSTEPNPEVTVARTIIDGTVVKSQKSQTVIKGEKSRCRIHEMCSKETGIPFYEMIITDL